MSLLDSMSSLLGQNAGNAAGQGDLMQALLGLLSPQAPGGGLVGLVQHFQQGGLGEVVQSWISTGQNLPISTEQLQSVLGQHAGLAGLLQASGLDQGTTLSQLTRLLPEVIDQLTPQGRLPDSSGTAQIGDLLGNLLGR
jgi:uncharacterized protein YidB (DUF937 family)